MTGLDKIIEKIDAESKQRCAKTIEQAKKKADQIAQTAQKDCEAQLAKINEDGKKQIDLMLEMASSSSTQKSKKIILTAKNEAINLTLSNAAKALRELPDDQYFDAFKSIAVENACEGEGSLSFGSADIARLPANFEAELNRAVARKNAKIKVCKTPADISDGFILAYGDIEYNCTIEALIGSNRDELKEIICGIIFR